MREMKDSGIEWLGMIPKSWRVERLQWHLYEVVEKNNPVKTTQVLSLTNQKGVIPYEEKGNQGNTAKENYDEYKIAYPHTIVANSMNILIGSVGYSNYYGCVSPVYYVFKENFGNELKFINYIMQVPQFQRELRKYSNGILEIRLRVAASDILHRKCAFPLLEEQQRVADYLNTKCSLIDSIIAKQEAIIKKLKEYRIAFISERIKMIDTEKTSLGRVIVGIEQGWSPKPSERNEESVWKVLTLAAVKHGKFYKNEFKPLTQIVDKCKRIELKDGDFLLTRANTRELVGQVCIVENIDDNTIFSDLIYRLYFNEQIVLPKFMLLYFQTAMMRQQISRDAHGSSETMVKITHKDIASWMIDIPKMEDQKAFVKVCNEEYSKIDRELDYRDCMITKLEQYKKSLIYEAVTGKKEV